VDGNQIPLLDARSQCQNAAKRTLSVAGQGDGVAIVIPRNINSVAA